MKLTLKPLDEQVIVITGASTGNGLVTAKQAAHRGARVVLAARNARISRRLPRQFGAEASSGIRFCRRAPYVTLSEFIVGTGDGATIAGTIVGIYRFPVPKIDRE
jgi:NAD(P)-dependent dehydrogenase (short-subunit alcohol dehydrogenase family)